MRRALNNLTLRKQTPSTRLHTNIDLYATGTSLRSRTLKLKKVFSARKQRQETADVLESEPPATEPTVLPTIESPPAGSDHVATEMATTPSPALNSTSNDPTDPLRTVSTTIGTMNTVVTQVQTTQILNNSHNPNFNNSMLSNVNGNSVTNHYYFGPHAVRMLPDGSFRFCNGEVNSSEIPQSTVNQGPVDDAGTSAPDAGSPTPDAGSPAPDAHSGSTESESQSEGSRPINDSADQSLREDSVPSDSDRFVVHMVKEARLTLPSEIFELKTVIPFFFFNPDHQASIIMVGKSRQDGRSF